MAKTYNNVPMRESEKKRVEREDATWTGPKLLILCFGTLALALFVLWMASTNIIGPTIHQ